MSPIPGDSRQDPHRPDEEDISITAMENNVIVAGSSSDSAGEEEDNGHPGYQILAQDPEDVEEDDYSAAESQAADGSGGDSSQSFHVSANEEELPSPHVPSYLQVPDIPDSELAERQSLWSETSLHPHEPMDEDHMNKIKSAMSGFHLPGCHVPDWARVVSEEEWKTQLLTRLHQRANLVHSPPSSHDSVECSDPPSKRAKCGLEQDDEDEMSDDENSTGEGTSVSQTENDTEQR